MHGQMDPMRESRTKRVVPQRTSGWARTLACAAALAAVTLSACSSDSPTGPGSSSSTPVGNYTITTVNGKSLPVALAADGNYLYEVTVGTLSITSDGKYSVVTTFRQTIPGNVQLFVDSTGGSWVLNGTTINLTNGQDGSADQATWANKQLTFAESDGTTTTTYVYSRK